MSYRAFGLPAGVSTASLAAKADKADLPTNVRHHGAAGDGVTDDTDAIQAVLAAAEPGDVIYLPAGTYLISDALLVDTADLTIRGESRTATVVEQATWQKPGFDILDADGVTVEAMTIEYSGASRTMGGTSFRASNTYVYSAGVWTNGSRTTVRDVWVKRFVCGVFLSSYDTGGGVYEHGRVGNRVLDCEMEEIDFGVLYLGQIAPEIRGLYTHDHLDASEGANPTHALYGSGTHADTLPSSVDATISDITCVNNLTGSAIVTKFTRGGVMSGITARDCAGVLDLLDVHDLLVANVVAEGMDMDLVAANSAPMTVGYTTGSDKVTVSNVRLSMASGGRAVVLIADDSSFSNLDVVSNRSGSTSEYSVHLRGSRSTLDGLRLVEEGTPSNAVLVGTSGYVTDGYRVRGVSLRNTLSGVVVDSTATNTAVEGRVPFFCTFGDDVGAAISQTAGSASVVAANGALVVRFVPPRDLTLSKLTWISLTSSGNYDIGILSAAGARLWSKGATAWSYGATATVAETVSPAVRLIADTTYYLIFAADNNTGSMRGVSANAAQATGVNGVALSLQGSSLYPIPSSVTVGSLSAVGRLPLVMFGEF